MPSTLYDASFYVAALRRGDEGVIALRRLDSGSLVWLSAVVLQELYAGAGENGRDVVERLERDFDRVKRIPCRISVTGLKLVEYYLAWRRSMTTNRLGVVV